MSDLIFQIQLFFKLISQKQTSPRYDIWDSTANCILGGRKARALEMIRSHFSGTSPLEHHKAVTQNGKSD